MDDPKLQPLKEMAAKLAQGDSPDDRIAALQRAFELFSLETQRLENAYNSLKEEFAEIHYELEETNKKLLNKVAELDAMRSYHNRIFNNISQGILFIDLNGDVTTYNSAAEQLLGIKAAKVLQYTFWQNFDDTLFGFSVREALAAKGSPPLHFASIAGPKNKLRELEVNSSFVLEKEEPDKSSSVRKMQGLIVLLRDITEIRSLQKVAERNERMRELGIMAAMVAHEIRNPLGGIKGFASLLRRDLENQPHLKTMAEHIVEGTDALNRLVTNVLDYSRPAELKKEMVDLLDLLKSLKSHIAADEKLSKGISLAIQCDEKQLPLFLDIQLIKAALLNMVTNAIQSMPKGGCVTISVSADNGVATIRVADQGVGIAPEHLEKIFTPFFTTKKGGSGFGLAEVYKVVQAHEGSIDVASTVGEGSTFTVTLPIKNLKE